MHATVEHVHHRHRQGAGIGAADIAVERQRIGLSRRLGDGQRHAEDGVGAEPALVGRAVERDHGLVDVDLVLGLKPADRLENLAVDRVHGLLHALAAVALLVAVAQLHRLMGASRGAGGNRGAAKRAVLQDYVDLDGGVAAAVKDFAADDIDDRGHKVFSEMGPVGWLAPAFTGGGALAEGTNRPVCLSQTPDDRPPSKDSVGLIEPIGRGGLAQDQAGGRSRPGTALATGNAGRWADQTCGRRRAKKLQPTSSLRREETRFDRRKYRRATFRHKSRETADDGYSKSRRSTQLADQW